MFLRSLSLLSRSVLTTLAVGGAVSAVALAHPPGEVAGYGAPIAPSHRSGIDPALIPSNSHLTLVGAAIAEGVDRRQPIGEGDTFEPSVGALYAWIKVRNLGEDTTVTVVWKREGKRRMMVTLPVGHSYGWRTWSKKRIAPGDAGLWTVEVIDAEGVLVGSVGFAVESQRDVVPEVGAL